MFLVLIFELFDGSVVVVLEVVFFDWLGDLCDDVVSLLVVCWLLLVEFIVLLE